MLRRDASRKEIADWLRDVRDAAGLTQEEAAEEAGVARRTMLNWESGHATPLLIGDLLRYLVALDVRIEPAPPIKRESSLREQIAEANRKLDVLSGQLGVSSADLNGSSPRPDAADVGELLEAVRKMLGHLEGLAGPDSARWLNEPEHERVRPQER